MSTLYTGPPAPPPSKAIRRNFGKRRSVSLSEWSRKHVRVTEGPLVHGEESIPYNPDIFPLQREVVASIESNSFTRTVLVSAPQAFGKTQCAAIPVLLYSIDYLRRACLYVTSSLDLAQTQWDEKIKPTLEASKRLRRLIPQNTDNAGRKGLRKFTNTVPMHMAGAESVGSLSAFTAPTIVVDDVQAFNATVGPRFGHAADYAISRAESYPSEQRTFVFIGTASVPNEWLWTAFISSTMYFPFVPCCKCSTYQMIELSRMIFSDDPREARRECFMACANDDCDHRITFDELPTMLKRAVWCSMPPSLSWKSWLVDPPATGVTIDLKTADLYPNTSRNTNSAGFWCSAYYWPHGLTWGERAAEYLECKDNEIKRRTYQQNVQVIPYQAPEVDEAALTEDEIKSHVDIVAYAAKTIPDGVNVLNATVDVHSGELYFIIRGWIRECGTSFLIDCDRIGEHIREVLTEQELKERRAAAITRGLDEVASMDFRGWRRHDGSLMHLTLGVVDCGWAKDIVMAWQQLHADKWHCVRGLKAGLKGSEWPIKPQYDSMRRPFRLIDVNSIKHTVRRLLRIPAHQPGYWHMPSEGIHVNTLRMYYRHMIAEHYDETLKIPKWTNKDDKSSRLTNHLWDDEVYHIAAAVACGVQYPGSPAPVIKTAKEFYRKKIRR